MLLGLYNPELRKTCLMSMPKDIKDEREIKAVLDRQLENLRTYNLDPRAQPRKWQVYKVHTGMIRVR